MQKAVNSREHHDFKHGYYYTIKELSHQIKIRHWSRRPVSVRADRWLRAGRQRRLIRVDATRSTSAEARQWYMS